MFFNKKSIKISKNKIKNCDTQHDVAYNADYTTENSLRPCIHISICTGEKVAGFKNTTTGKFQDIMLIRDDKDLKKFLKEYKLKEEDLIKDW